MRFPNDCIVKGDNPGQAADSVWLTAVSSTLKIEHHSSNTSSLWI